MLQGIRLKVFFTCLTAFVCAAAVATAENRVSRDHVEMTSKGDDSQNGSVVDVDRSWEIITRDSYWPLVRQSSEHLEMVARRIGTGDPMAVAGELERLAAWFKITQASGMTSATSGVSECRALAAQAAESIRNGETEWTDQRLRDLVAYSHICVAKSHIDRAVEFDNNFIAPPRRASESTRTPLARVLRQLEAEIEAQRVARGLAQYRYDTLESMRHYEEAMYYFTRAVEIGQLDVDAKTIRSVTVPDDLSKRVIMAGFVGRRLRPALERIDKSVSMFKHQYDAELVDFRR